MSYRKATQVLPEALLRQVQQYVDGEFLYIPSIPGTEKQWGAGTTTRQELRERNQHIYQAYLAGSSMNHLADEKMNSGLSPKGRTGGGQSFSVCLQTAQKGEDDFLLPNH